MGLNEIKAAINKKCGTNIMFSAADELGIMNIPRFSTGSLMLDVDSGGGWPENKIIEIYGPESSGKSFILYNALREITKRDTFNKALLIDDEGSFDVPWAKSIGINLKNLEICRSEYAEQSLDVMELGAQSGEFALVGLDSIAALIPKEELDASTEENQAMALTARLLGKACRKAYKALNSAKKKGSPTTIMLINQIRSKVGIVFGNPEVTPGGNAVKFASSIRASLRKTEALKANEEVFGQLSEYTFVKNKTAPPLRKGEVAFSISGVNKAKFHNYSALFDLGLHIGKIVQSGAWYSGDWLKKKAQGRNGVVADLTSYPVDELNAYVKEIEDELMDGSPIAFRFS